MEPPQAPPSLKQVSGHFKLATDNQKIDPVISYWCRLYAIQAALKIDGKSKEAKQFLMYMMDLLEKEKKSLKDNEAVTNEMVAQAHCENYAMKLFEKADSEDRNGQATLKTVKTFFTAAQCFDVLTVFGELSEEIAQRLKYAKWRAAVIMKAIKSGEQPPPPENRDDLYPPTPFNEEKNEFTGPKDDLPNTQIVTIPQDKISSFHADVSENLGESSSGEYPMSPGSAMKAQKYCKFAGSALQYNDVNTAIGFLEKALLLLKTGSENV